MTIDLNWFLIPSFFVIALLYASVGHGGASGYLAVLSLIAVRPDEMTTTALTLNVVVAALALISFQRAGHFDGKLTWPFLAASVPAAFLGGLVPVPVHIYQRLLAMALGVAALRLLIEVRGRNEAATAAPRWSVALPLGGSIGLLSGAVGIGGGIFLSPLLLLRGWASPHQAAATSAGFIVVNSAAALLGRWIRHGLAYETLWPLLLAACAGGVVGARLGANHFSGRALRRLLAVVLLVAAIKMVVP